MVAVGPQLRGRERERGKEGVVSGVVVVGSEGEE
jgi:hypothetical protein